MVDLTHLGGESDLGPCAASSCGGAEFRERFGGRGMAKHQRMTFDEMVVMKSCYIISQYILLYLHIFLCVMYDCAFLQI